MITLSEALSNFSGTTNYVAKYTPTGNVLGLSQIFDNGTNVGIGTTTPSAKLDVLTDSGAAFIAESTLDGNGVLAYFRNNDPATTNNQETQIDFQQQTSTIGRISLWHINSSISGFKLYGYDSFLNSVPMLSLRGDKLSGVNTDNPLANWHIVSVSGNNPFRVDDTNSGTTPIFVENGGKVGFNKTSSLSALVNIKGTDSTSSNYSLKIDNSASSPLLYVRNDGNVGIGTTTPTAKLEVNGNIKTAQPSANGAGAWKLGKKVTATVSLVTTDYIEVEIDSVVYKLALVS